MFNVSPYILLRARYSKLSWYFSLDTGQGDVTYNARRSIFAAIPITGNISYHLWNIGYSGQGSNDSVRLLRKSKWLTEHLEYRYDGIGNYLNTIPHVINLLVIFPFR